MAASSTQRYSMVWKCDAGHTLVSKTLAQLARESAGYRTGYRCNICQVSYAMDPVMHCTACTYDLCPSCVNAKVRF